MQSQSWGPSRSASSPSKGLSRQLGSGRRDLLPTPASFSWRCQGPNLQPSACSTLQIPLGNSPEQVTFKCTRAMQQYGKSFMPLPFIEEHPKSCVESNHKSSQSSLLSPPGWSQMPLGSPPPGPESTSPILLPTPTTVFVAHCFCSWRFHLAISHFNKACA